MAETDGAGSGCFLLVSLIRIGLRTTIPSKEVTTIAGILAGVEELFRMPCKELFWPRPQVELDSYRSRGSALAVNRKNLPHQRDENVKLANFLLVA